MKLVAGGIGVDAVSNTPDGLRLYVNEAFAKAHTGESSSLPRLGLSRASRCEGGWELHFSPHAAVLMKPGKAYRSQSNTWLLHRAWNGAAKMPPGLPIGGKTSILDLRTAPDGGYIVTIPGVLNPSGKIGAIRRSRERRAAEEARDPSSVPAASPPTCGVAELQDAIRVVNTCIESMGNSLVISLEGEPRRLRAMIELG